MPSSVKWIRIDLGIFDHPKIKYIRTLPEGDSIVLFWVYLLSKAGKCNENGCVFITSNVPYTIDSLSREGNFTHSTVKLAMDLFTKLEMIETDETGYIYITGWGEYQNYDALEKRRQSDRIRQTNRRISLKQLPFPNDVTLESRDKTDNVTVTSLITLGSRDKSKDVASENGGHVMVTGQSRDGAIIEERVKKKDTNNVTINKDNISKNNGKVEYSPFVFLTQEEYSRLIERFGEVSVKDKLESLSLYIQSKGAKYKSHYATILLWDRRDNKNTQTPKPVNSNKYPRLS